MSANVIRDNLLDAVDIIRTLKIGLDDSQITRGTTTW